MAQASLISVPLLPLYFHNFLLKMRCYLSCASTCLVGRAVGCYGGDHHVGPADKIQFRTEMERLIEQHLSYPSIVAWVVFNEGWGQHDTVHLAK